MDKETCESMMKKCQEFYETHSIEFGKKGFIWLRNDETGELMVYTRGEYTNEILDFLKNKLDGEVTQYPIE